MSAQQRDLSKATGGEPEAVRIWLLGGFRVSVGASRSIADDGWRLRKAGNLVKLLALAGDHRLHREQAAGLLWPDLDPRAATNNLHHALYVARRTLEPAVPAGAVPSYLQLATSGWPSALTDRCGWTSGRSRKRRARPGMAARPRPTVWPWICTRASFCPRTATNRGRNSGGPNFVNSTSRCSSNWPHSMRSVGNTSRPSKH